MKYNAFGLNAYKKETESNQKSAASASKDAGTRKISFPIFEKIQRKDAETRIISGIENTERISKEESPASGQSPRNVRSPNFQRISSVTGLPEEKENAEKKKLDEETLRQAEFAAKSGTWFAKKAAATTEDVKNAADNLKSMRLLKVSSPPEGEKDSIYRRVAKFLVLIGLDEAAKIMPHLTEEQTEKIIPEIATIRKIDKEEADRILQEFDSLLERSRETGGFETARTILAKAYGPVKANDILDKAVAYTENRPFEYLADANPDRIRVLIESEPVGVQAIVLSQIGSARAAKVINEMNVDQKREVILRLAKMKSVAPEVLSQIDRSLHDKMLAQNTENSQNMDGRSVLAQILKRMPMDSETNIISSLMEQDPELGADIRKRLFTEEDVIAGDDVYLQNYLHEREERDIAVLIHGKSDAFRQKILRNVSRNRARIILDEESIMKIFSQQDMDRVTNQFYSALRHAWEDGSFRIMGRDDDEIYVE